MDVLVVAVAVVAWLLLILPAALALVARNAGLDLDEGPAPPAHALTPPRAAELADRAAA